jgi:hypothetical protein
MNGHPALKTPYKTSEFRAMVSAMRAHHNAMHDQCQNVAAELRKLLPTAKGAFRVDAKINAWRVARRLAHIGAVNKAAAKHYSSLLQTYEELFTNPDAGKHSRYDVNG